jgi:hypothetical protein
MSIAHRWHDAAQHIMIIELPATLPWDVLLTGFEEAMQPVKVSAHPVVVILQANDVPMPQEGNAFSQLQRMIRTLPTNAIGLIPVVGKSRAFERTTVSIAARMMLKKHFQITTSLDEAITMAQGLLQKAA